MAKELDYITFKVVFVYLGCNLVCNFEKEGQESE